MATRFRPGSAAFAKDGRRYVVDDVADGIVYCRSAAGAETEFSESQLLNEAEWSARSGDRTELLYGEIRQSNAFASYKGKLDRAAADRLLAKADRLVPGILDFVAFVTAERALAKAGQGEAAAELSIVRCRAFFDAATPETRAALLAGLIGSPPEVLVGAVDRGDNLLRAMIDRAAGAGTMSFESFRARRRR